ncbi:hypothetical protein BW737_014260 [Actinomyces ruminis]|uniref:Thioredoxin n=1 Tax=Actinomyces ruminis TaxID=1937003 RepID=A0ABX4M8X9_9ACTO|nr:hypothetical protein BW737_014260 [Actinomyces ruminis]
MPNRVIALTRSRDDELTTAATAPFARLADVALIDVERSDASFLVSRLGIKQLPAWIYPLGDGMIIVVGTPEPLIQHLRESIRLQDRMTSPPPGAPDTEITQIRDSISIMIINSYMKWLETRRLTERARASRAEVLERIEGLTDQLYPATQVSRLTRRLHMPKQRTLHRSEFND